MYSKVLFARNLLIHKSVQELIMQELGAQHDMVECL